MHEQRRRPGVSELDLGRSRTAHDLDGLRDAATRVSGRPIRKMLDVGCGYGGLSMIVGEVLGAEAIFGVDIDERVVAEASHKGVEVTLHAAGHSPMPFTDGEFDFVMSLGMMDYLEFYDGLIRDMNRVLLPGGAILISLPNLASWHNRLMLLGGYQPRDVEISSELLVGVPSAYQKRSDSPTGHIHTSTVRAFTELMTHHGFKQVALLAGMPTMGTNSRLIRTTDRVLSHWPTLARRFYYVGTREKKSPKRSHAVRAPFECL
jgi:SAM-dependent methyltransferase